MRGYLGEFVAKATGLAADRVGYPQWVEPKYTGGGDLGEVRDAEHLAGAGQGLEFLADGFSGASADAGIDFVAGRKRVP